MIIDLKFHHIGIACFNIELTKEFYVKLGYKSSKTIDDPIQNIKICFLYNAEMPEIELLAPLNDNSPVNRILKVVGVSPYHICYEVTDINESIKYLRKEHFMVISKPVPACAIENNRVCFLFNKSVGLIELVEYKIS